MSKIVYDKYNNVRKISKHITKTDQKCSSRCALTFSYGLSDCSIQNNGDHIELSYDPNVSTVIFNSATYKVTRIGFYAFWCSSTIWFKKSKWYNDNCERWTKTKRCFQKIHSGRIDN